MQKNAFLLQMVGVVSFMTLFMEKENLFHVYEDLIYK